MKQFLLPDPGEGLVEAEIVAWHVAVGDEVKVNDVVVEIETSKSLVELPIPWAGRVVALLATEGATVQVGTPIITIDDGTEQSAPASPTMPASAPTETPLLVGYGSTHGEGTPRRRRGRPTGTVTPAADVPDAPPGASPASAPAAPAADDAEPLPARRELLAKPPVRFLARLLGVDLHQVRGSGPHGTITRADVEAAAKAGERAEGSRREPIRGVRKVTAQAMVDSVSEHVHVTEWVTIDVTATMELVERLKTHRDFRDLKVTPLLLHAKAVCLAMARTPVLNASWDAAHGEIVHHDDVNLGIAAATPRGLMVPVVKAAQAMSLVELCGALNDRVAVARAGKLQPDDYSGGTFTITNVGVFGIDAGTPVINRDESAILCLGAINRRPWVVGEGADERIEPRWVTTLALSFDHRLIDGEQGSRFLRDVADILERPELALLY